MEEVWELSHFHAMKVGPTTLVVDLFLLSSSTTLSPTCHSVFEVSSFHSENVEAFDSRELPPTLSL